MRVKHLAGLIISALVTLSGVAFASQKSTSMSAGERIFRDSCAICHGSTGKGDGVGVEFLSKLKKP